MIQQYIEHTALKPTLVQQDIENLIDEAKSYGFLGVCVPPFWVRKAKRDIGHSSVRLVTVIGFPLGYSMTQVKVAEMKQAISDGADELDMVINVSAVKTRAFEWIKPEIAQLAAIAHENEKILKVIIETAYLTQDEIIKCCNIAAEAGADFLKTSTGFAPEGAKLEHIKLMRSVLPQEVGIKASGGIKNIAFAQSLIEAGADRLGTSSGVEIVKGLQSTNHY